MNELQVEEELKNSPFDNNEELFSGLEYDANNKLHYIEVSNPFDEFDLQLIYNGIDLFKTKANDIIESISKHASYIQDDQSEMGFYFSRVGTCILETGYHDRRYAKFERFFNRIKPLESRILRSRIFTLLQFLCFLPPIIIDKLNSLMIQARDL